MPEINPITVRQELHLLLDHIPDEDVPVARKFLRWNAAFLRHATDGSLAQLEVLGDLVERHDFTFHKRD